MNKFLILPILLLPLSVGAVSWIPPTQYEDNTPLNQQDIAGYTIDCGTSSGNYDTEFNVPDGTLTNFTITFPTAGTRYCAMKTIDVRGNNSTYYSNEKSKYFIAVSNTPNILVDFEITKVDGLTYRFSYKLPTTFTDGRAIQPGDITKLYLFRYTDTKPDGFWDGDINPPVETFDRVLEEGYHLYNMEVEVKLDGQHYTSKRSMLVELDVTVIPDVSTPIKPPTLFKFGEEDIIQIP